jgi:hypothetical protein
VEEKPEGGSEGVKILFWGTPEFSVPSLRALGEEGHDIVGVVTRPDRPAGRGRELRASAVKTEALDQIFRILEPESARSDDFAEEIAGLGAVYGWTEATAIPEPALGYSGRVSQPANTGGQRPG